MASGDQPTSRVRRSPLGVRIRELRGAATLRELADTLGIDYTYLSKIENGGDIPGEAMLQRVADHFGVSADDLLALAGKVPSELTELARNEAAMGRLLRRLPGLSPEQRSKIYDVAGIDPGELPDD